MTEREVFLEALDRATPEARAAYLEEACAQDVTLRRKVDELLKEHFSNDGLLAGPALEGDRTAVVNSPATESPAPMLGRYKLLEKIGEGGFGEVWMAEQREPIKRRVAVKIIKLGMDSRQIVARFEAERQALAMMDHPNIAKIFDAGTAGEAGSEISDLRPEIPDLRRERPSEISNLKSQIPRGRPYFVMELVRGTKITEYCDQNQLPTKERLRLFILVCQAIQHAHQKGIIHRDIKPSNILVTLHDGVPVPKVIDFGIAKATQQELTNKTVFTQFQQFMGTPAYISPEQAEMSGLDIDTRADIYSLGVLLYELLVGQTPFDAQEMMQGGLDALRRIIREKEPLRPSTKLNTLPGEARTTAGKRRQTDVGRLVHQLQGDLDWIVMKCLEKDRTRRYETANGLASDIQRHLTNEAILARPPSAAYRFQKMVRRNKLAFAALSAVTLTLIAGLSFSTWAFLSEAAQRRTAVEQRMKAEAAQASEAQQRSKADAEKITAQRHLYVANMNLAQQAWEQNNIVRLRQLLEETQASPDRGFEWYYWQRQVHLALKTLRGHLGTVTAVNFSPDSRRIVTGSFDQTAKIWDVATGRELLTLKGHRAGIRSAAFSPDGQRIVTGSHDQAAKIWDTATGRELLTIEGHGAQVFSVAFSPDSQRILTGNTDNTAKLWEASSGRELLTLSGHRSLIWSVAFSPDGQRIATGSRDRTAKVWDAASGRESLALKGHTYGVLSVAFSPDGQRIVTGSQDHTAKVWEAASGRELLTLQGHNDIVRSVVFSPDGQRIVTGSLDHTAKVWDAATGQELFTLKGHTGAIMPVAISPDGQQIVTGCADQTAKVWDAASSRESLMLTGHGGAIYSVVFSPDGQRIATGSWDHTARLWDAISGRELRTLKGHNLGVLSVAFSPDGQRIATGSWDHTARVWEADSGRELFTLKGHGASIWSVAFSPDGQRIVTGSYDQTARLWEATSGREILKLKGHSARIWSVAFSPDGQRIVTGSEDQTAKMWDVASGRELLTLKGHSGLIKAVAFSPEGQRIVTGGADQTVKVWATAGGRELLTLKGHGSQVRSVAFSPDGRRILTGSADQAVKVWEAASGLELLTLSGNTTSIWSVAFSPDGQQIVTGSADPTATVWRAATSEEVVAWRAEEKAAAQYLANLQRERTAEQDLQRIARAGDEGAIKRWLILAPIAFPYDQSGADAVNIEQIEGENRLRPKAGEGTVMASGGLKWQEVAPVDYVLDFNAILGVVTHQSVAYVVCYIRSETEQHGLRMLVGSDDEAKVYLNGKLIYQYLVGRDFVEDQDTVSGIALNAGLNTLVFKVVNEWVGWKGSIRFTDAQGNPVHGIQVTLDPGG